MLFSVNVLGHGGLLDCILKERYMTVTFLSFSKLHVNIVGKKIFHVINK